VDLLAVGDVLAVAWCVWFCHFYGYVENRWFREQGEAVVFEHFSLYHTFWLTPLFGFHAFVLAHSMQSVFGLNLLQTVLVFLVWMIYEPVGLDWVWWFIRYMDINHLGETWWIGPFPIWVFPVKNLYDYGVGLPWHNPDGSDWDACNIIRRFFPKVPLVWGVKGFRAFWWWWVLPAISLALGIAVFLVA
jgi:hypothetical protein